MAASNFQASLACALMLAAPARAHDHPPEHAQLHEQFYQHLMRPDVPGGRSSCCNNRDCAPAQARFRNGKWQFLYAGTWRDVPQSKIVSDRSPDAGAHACVLPSTGELLCFVKPDFGI